MRTGKRRCFGGPRASSPWTAKWGVAAELHSRTQITSTPLTLVGFQRAQPFGRRRHSLALSLLF
ncbi:hypothetical protein NY78_2350 [Desulfovibrio sp. TomC]|nr:hypothetical protein NY78_2350 [Desulfovibrio sp. TomC]